MAITGAYAHCGLRKHKPVEPLDATMQRHGVERTVLVQHLGEYDNSYIQSLVEKRPRRFADVFLVDTDRPGAMDEITRWARTGAFRCGLTLRHTARDRSCARCSPPRPPNPG